MVDLVVKEIVILLGIFVVLRCYRVVEWFWRELTDWVADHRRSDGN